MRCGRKCDVEVLRHVQFVEQVPKNAFSKKVSVGRRAQRRQTPEKMAACTRLFVKQLTAGGRNIRRASSWVVALCDTPCSKPWRKAAVSEDSPSSFASNDAATRANDLICGAESVPQIRRGLLEVNAELTKRAANVAFRYYHCLAGVATVMRFVL